MGARLEKNQKLICGWNQSAGIAQRLDVPLSTPAAAAAAQVAGGGRSLAQGGKVFRRSRPVGSPGRCGCRSKDRLGKEHPG